VGVAGVSGAEFVGTSFLVRAFLSDDPLRESSLFGLSGGCETSEGFELIDACRLWLSPIVLVLSASEGDAVRVSGVNAGVSTTGEVKIGRVRSALEFLRDDEDALRDFGASCNLKSVLLREELSVRVGDVLRTCSVREAGDPLRPDSVRFRDAEYWSKEGLRPRS